MGEAATTSNDRRPPPLLSVQALRAVAAWMVVAYHLATTDAYGWQNPEAPGWFIGAYARAIGFAGVDLFFVISGVVMVYSSYDHFGQRSGIAPFLKRRIARIYPLYWVCTFAVLGLAWLAPGLASRNKFDWLVVGKSLLLWPQPEYPIVGVGWTLTFEMYFYVVFAALIALPRRFLPIALALWAAGTLAAFALLDRPAYRESAEAQLQLPLFASPLALEFIAGCYVGWQARRGAMPGGGIAFTLGAAAILLAGGYFGTNYPNDVHTGLGRVALFGAAATLIAYGLIALEKHQSIAIPAFVKHCGDSSYSLYLSHMYVLWAIAVVWPWRHAATSPSPHITMTLVGLIACGLVATISFMLIERPLHRLFLQILSVAQPRGPGRTVAD